MEVRLLDSGGVNGSLRTPEVISYAHTYEQYRTARIHVRSRMIHSNNIENAYPYEQYRNAYPYEQRAITYEQYGTLVRTDNTIHAYRVCTSNIIDNGGAVMQLRAEHPNDYQDLVILIKSDPKTPK